MEGPSINIEDLGVRVSNVERRREKINYSGWLITISTNFRPKSIDEAQECGDVLRLGIKNMLSAQGLKEIVDFVKFTPSPSGRLTPKGRPVMVRELNPDHHWSTEWIKKVEGEFVVERGRHRQGGRIHAHVVLKIEHTSRIQLNKDKMKYLLLEYFADHDTMSCIRSLYINIKLISKAGMLANYLRKEALDAGLDSGAPGTSS